MNSRRPAAKPDPTAQVPQGKGLLLKFYVSVLQLRIISILDGQVRKLRPATASLRHFIFQD
jgi:hypothetical protein